MEVGNHPKVNWILPTNGPVMQITRTPKTNPRNYNPKTKTAIGLATDAKTTTLASEKHAIFAL